MSPDTDSITEVFGEVIHAYTRAQAIDDGVLVDVTETAQEAGFRWPVAITRAAWEDLVAWDDGNAAYQDEAGRLWDVLWMAFLAIKFGVRGRPDQRISYTLRRIPNRRRCTVARLAQASIVSGPGDDGAPVVTIMLPNED